MGFSISIVLQSTTPTRGSCTSNLQTGSFTVESGLRFYSPDTGRWLNRDPIEEDGGLSLFAFIENDPVDFVDVQGKKKHQYPGFGKVPPGNQPKPRYPHPGIGGPIPPGVKPPGNVQPENPASPASTCAGAFAAAVHSMAKETQGTDHRLF